MIFVYRLFAMNVFVYGQSYIVVVHFFSYLYLIDEHINLQFVMHVF